MHGAPKRVFVVGPLVRSCGLCWCVLVADAVQLAVSVRAVLWYSVCNCVREHSYASREFPCFVQEGRQADKQAI